MGPRTLEELLAIWQHVYDAAGVTVRLGAPPGAGKCLRFTLPGGFEILIEDNEAAHDQFESMSIGLAAGLVVAGRGV